MPVPRNLTDGDVEECSLFRTRERFPMLSYFYKSSGTSIWRSSQPKEGLWGKISKGDQRMVQAIADTAPARSMTQYRFAGEDPKKYEVSLHVVDARSRMAAIGNKITGSGYENPAHYPFVWLMFSDIANINTVRDSFQKLHDICTDLK